MLNVALVGAGSFADMHLRAYAATDDARVGWLCEPDAARREEYAGRYEVSRVTADYTQALDDDEVDVVDIVAPNHVHRDIAVQAVRAGKHVLCEKPMARTTAEARDMVEAARNAGRQLHVKYHQRFTQPHRLMKTMWDTGQMPGAVVTVARRMDSHLQSMLDPHHWRGIPALTGGGCLFSSGSHTLDLLHFIFGPASAVTATTAQLVADDPSKADDNATVVIEYPSGMVATFVGCWTVQHIKWATTEIYSTDATVRSRTAGDSLLLERETADGVQKLAEADNWFTSSNIAAIHHFVDCLRGVAEPLYTAEDCLASMATLEAVYRSAEQQCRVEVDRWTWRC